MKEKNKPLHIIFDFDGTLADSFSAIMEKLIPLADTFKFKKINQDEITRLKDLTSREVIKYLKIPFYKLPALLRHARECMRTESAFLPIFLNLSEVLAELHQHYSLGILTSNSSENVMSWLNRHKITHLFTFIHTESSYFGKKYWLKKLVKSQAMNPLQTFYIGDETRDIEAARKCRINSIAVSWGFNSETALVQSNPDYIARVPADILTIVKHHELLPVNQDY